MEDISKPLQKMGTATQEVIPNAMSGPDVERAGMRKARALRELAAGQEALGQGIGSALKSIGGALERMGAGDAQDMARQGDIEGRNSVVRDEHGDIRVQPTSTSLFGKSGEHYANAAYAGAVNAGRDQLRADLTKIAANNVGNPEGLRAGVDGYLHGHLGGLGSGQVGQTLLLDAKDYGQQFINHSITTKAASDFQSAEQGIRKSVTNQQNDLEALALGGAVKTPAFFKTFADQQANLDSLTGNFGVSRGEVDALRKTNTSRIEEFTLQGAMASAFKTGGLNAAAGVVGSIDARTDISDADKARLRFAGEAHLDRLKSANSQDTTANQTAFKELMQLQEKGSLPPREAWQDIEKRALFLGDTGTAHDARKEIENHHWVSTAVTLSPSQQDRANGVGAPYAGGVPPPPSGPTRRAAAYNYFTGHGWSPEAAHAMVATLSGESGQGLDPNSLNRNENTGGVFGGSFGLANWDAHRQGRLVVTSGSVSNARTFDAQLAFVDREAREMGLPITSRNNPRDLTVHFTGTFERPTVNNGASRWASYSGSKGGEGQASGRSITWDDLHNSSPGMAPTYIKALAGQSEVRSRYAETLIDSSTKSLQNNTPVSQETMVQIEQLATPEARTANPGLDAKYAEYEKTVVASHIAAGGSNIIDQARAEALAQPDMLPRQMVDKAETIRNTMETQLRENPVQAAQNGRWIDRPPVPLDPGSPQTIPLHFAGNAAVVDAISAREPGFSKSVVFKNEVGAFGATMAGPASAGLAVLSSILALPQDKQDATLEMPGVRAAIIGMANSTDPDKKRAAFAFMDHIYRQEPQTFEGKFEHKGLLMLRDWQDTQQFHTDKEIATEAATAYDPSTIRAREANALKADKILKDFTPAAVAAKLAPSWFTDTTPISDVTAQTNSILLEDHNRAFKEMYERHGNETSAYNYAKETIGVKWGPSVANGDRVMAYPPERSPAYPAINGSQDYIGKQLADFVTARGHDGAEAHLIAGRKARDEMISGKPIGYGVVVQGNDKQFVLLDGLFYADPAAAKKESDVRLGEGPLSGRRTAREFFRPTAGSGGPAQSPFDQARDQYPILNDVDMAYKYNPQQGKGYLEYWPPGEEGDKGHPRPAEFDINKSGLEVYKSETRPIDILGDVVSHQLVNTDPKIKQYYSEFVDSLTSEQKDRLKDQYSHAKQNEGETRPYKAWEKATGIPAYFRGYPFQQWDNPEKLYTKGQMAKLDEMMAYLKERRK